MVCICKLYCGERLFILIYSSEGDLKKSPSDFFVEKNKILQKEDKEDKLAAIFSAAFIYTLYILLFAQNYKDISV